MKMTFKFVFLIAEREREERERMNLLGCVQAQFRESFPNDLQLNSLISSLADQAQMSSLQVKSEILKHVEALAKPIQEI